jgi:hypothetical protein
MKKIAITKELLNLANELDNIKLFSEANTLTKIAKVIVAEDYKHDPMVYNPDDDKADVQEAHSMDYLDAMEALNKLVESGELEPNELSQIQSILSDSDSDDEGPDPFKEMSYENDEYNMEDYGMCPDCGEYLDDGVCQDCGYGEDEDDDDMGPEKEPFDYDSLEDEEDSMYGDDRKGYFDKDSDF